MDTLAKMIVAHLFVYTARQSAQPKEATGMEMGSATILQVAPFLGTAVG